MVPLAGICFGLAIVGLSSLIPLAFRISVASRTILRHLLIVFGFIMAVKTTNLHIVVGLLRSGGDTRYSLFMDVGILWAVGVPAAVVGGLIIGLPVTLVYILTGTEEVWKLILGVHRIRSGRWIHRLSTPVL
jgi:Na+-driven multidrug efflux pump